MEVMQENKTDSMILSENMEEPPQEENSELPSSPTFGRIMNILQGQDQSVQTVVIMSGQNPMAEKTDTAKNSMLAKKLEKDIAKMGLNYIPIGGKFEGLVEDSVMILNANREQAQKLNRMYKQWGYVWGQNMPNFQMIQIDYSSPAGDGVASGSKTATTVATGPEIQAASDNYSYDLESGRKFIIELY